MRVFRDVPCIDHQAAVPPSRAAVMDALLEHSAWRSSTDARQKSRSGDSCPGRFVHAKLRHFLRIVLPQKIRLRRNFHLPFSCCCIEVIRPWSWHFSSCGSCHRLVAISRPALQRISGLDPVNGWMLHLSVMRMHVPRMLGRFSRTRVTRARACFFQAPGRRTFFDCKECQFIAETRGEGENDPLA